MYTHPPICASPNLYFFLSRTPINWMLGVLGRSVIFFLFLCILVLIPERVPWFFSSTLLLNFDNHFQFSRAFSHFSDRCFFVYSVAVVLHYLLLLLEGFQVCLFVCFDVFCAPCNVSVSSGSFFFGKGFYETRGFLQGSVLPLSIFSWKRYYKAL